jgi:hypothetical protein
MSTTATITEVGARPISGRIVTQRIGTGEQQTRGRQRSAMWPKASWLTEFAS